MAAEQSTRPLILICDDEYPLRELVKADQNSSSQPEGGGVADRIGAR